MKTIGLSSKACAVAAGLVLSAACGSVLAEDVVANRTEGKTPSYPGIPSDSVEKFGGQAGIDVWVDDLFYYILADNRINTIFTSHGHVARQIALNKELENMVMGGPVHYSGASMSAAHSELGITLTSSTQWWKMPTWLVMRRVRLITSATRSSPPWLRLSASSSPGE